MRKQKFLWYAAAVLAVLGSICVGVKGMRFSGALCWCAAIGVIAYAVLDRLAAAKTWAKWCARALLALFCVGFAFFLYLEAQVISGAHGDAADKDVSCVIVLGAGVDGSVPSLTLARRLEATLDYIADKPDIPVIVSGGQGAGEDITEAECMYRWLVARGMDGSRVWKEERATSTRTNFAHSYALMAERGIDPAAGFAFVTSDYHVARAKRLAGTPKAYGVASALPRSAYYDALTANYYIREAFALANEMLLGVDLDL